MLLRWAMVLVCGIGLVGCHKPVKRVARHLQRVPVEAWPELVDDLPREDLIRALDRQLDWFLKQEQYRWELGDVVADRALMVATLTRFRELYTDPELDAQRLRQALVKDFELYSFRWQGREPILITGYHAPVYAGSLSPDDAYRFPLYAPPQDMVEIHLDRFSESIVRKGEGSRKQRVPARVEAGQVLPYYARAEIDGQGALAGRGLELVYLRDYFQAFSFHVQGGGFVRLPNSRFLRLNYAGSNGHSYRSIGRVAVNEGKIPEHEISMQALAAFFQKHPEDLERICFQNPSYVFYATDGTQHERLEADQFPNGVLGFPVATRRTIATDKRYFPGGGLAFIRGQQRGLDGPDRPFSAFVLDQDTGGAIRENHIDWFLGAGEEAEHDAGLLKDTAGEVYFLLLRRGFGGS